jgi:hypothetical protein
MNSAKLIKKMLRNKENFVRAQLIEFGPFGGDRILGEYKTFGLLKQAELNWKKQIVDEYGPQHVMMMDLPTIKFRIVILNKYEDPLHALYFHDIEDLREFLIGGFDGIVKVEGEVEGE